MAWGLPVVEPMMQPKRGFSGIAGGVDAGVLEGLRGGLDGEDAHGAHGAAERSRDGLGVAHFDGSADLAAEAAEAIPGGGHGAGGADAGFEALHHLGDGVADGGDDAISGDYRAVEQADLPDKIFAEDFAAEDAAANEKCGGHCADDAGEKGALAGGVEIGQGEAAGEIELADLLADAVGAAVGVVEIIAIGEAGGGIDDAHFAAFGNIFADAADDGFGALRFCIGNTPAGGA